MKNKCLLLAAALAALFVGARLFAQSGDGPDEAGKEFVAYLARQDFDSLRNIVARDSFKQLGDGGVDALLRDLRLVPDHMEAKAGDNGAAEVTPIFNAKPVVCRREGRFWRVDLPATAAKWLKLDDASGPRRLIRQYSVLPQFGEESRAACLSNLQSIAVALRQYAEDYDDRYPPANRWSDALSPFLRSEAAYHCPAVGKGNYGYAMNWRLSRLKHAAPALPAAIYEASHLQRNANGDGSDLVYRHEETAQTLFADGTVRALPRGQFPEWHAAKN